MFHDLHPKCRGPGELLPLKIDLIDPRTVATAAREFLEKETRLDFLSKVQSVGYLQVLTFTPLTMHSSAQA